MLVPLSASEVDYPPWAIVVMILGAGGLGGGIWAIVAKGWGAFKGISEILLVLRGNPGGNGTRKTEPLVDVVDGMAIQIETVRAEQATYKEEHTSEVAGVKAEVARLSAQMGDFQLDLTAVQDQVTPNGGNTDRLADRVVRLENAQTGQVDRESVRDGEAARPS